MKTKSDFLAGQGLFLFNDEDWVECFYSAHLDKFCIQFNAKLIFSSKNFNSFQHKIETIKLKYNLDYQTI